MIRLGMLGSDGGLDGGHAQNVCKIINEGAYDAKIVSIFGTIRAQSQALADEYGIMQVADSAEELLGNVDAVFVMHRDGNYHLKNAMPFIKAGLPVFIDKPFTCSVADAKKIKEEAEISKSIICGGTYVKYADESQRLKQMISEKTMRGVKILSGYIAFPLIMNNEHGGIHFYSHHLIEQVLTIFGEQLESVTATQAGGKIVVIAKYPEYPVIMNFAANYGLHWMGLHVGAYFDDETVSMNTLDISNGDTDQCERFLETIRTGRGESTDFFVKAVIISNAIVKSLEEKREITLKEVE